MKRGTLLHPELSRVIASLGHGDSLVIADAGLPIPAAVERIDLAFAPGKPAFMVVLEAVLAEMEVERAILAQEVKSASVGFHEPLHGSLASLPRSRPRASRFCCPRPCRAPPRLRRNGPWRPLSRRASHCLGRVRLRRCRVRSLQDRL